MASSTRGSSGVVAWLSIYIGSFIFFLCSLCPSTCPSIHCQFVNRGISKNPNHFDLELHQGVAYRAMIDLFTAGSTFAGRHPDWPVNGFHHIDNGNRRRVSSQHIAPIDALLGNQQTLTGQSL